MEQRKISGITGKLSRNIFKPGKCKGTGLLPDTAENMSVDNQFIHEKHFFAGRRISEG